MAMVRGTVPELQLKSQMGPAEHYGRLLDALIYAGDKGVKLHRVTYNALWHDMTCIVLMYCMYVLQACLKRVPAGLQHCVKQHSDAM